MQLPSFIQTALATLRNSGFEAFVVGGSVRDALLNREPKDWDLTTNAKPEEIRRVFSDTYTNNPFGTVVVRLAGYEIEVTPYRAEGEYKDGRHPEHVAFGVSLEEDLSRRDFTINAMAFDGERIVDPFGGQQDLNTKVIRAVGDPATRFQEDGLRLMRAVRLACDLNFDLEEKTRVALLAKGDLLRRISYERIRDEFMRMVMADNSTTGMWLLAETGLLDEFLPELSAGIRIGQNKHHIYSVFFHNVLALQYCPSDDPWVRLGALFHDIAKPQTKVGLGHNCTFYKHDIVGEEVTRRAMRRLRFSNEQIDRVAHLVRHHLFFYSVGEVSDAGVRRLLRRIGPENIQAFIDIRVSDRMGSGCQVEIPYKLRELQERMVEVQKEPISTKMLEIDGHDVMKLLNLKPGPKVGEILNVLLEEIIDDPVKNRREYLEGRAQVLGKSMPRDFLNNKIDPRKGQ